MSKSCLAVLLSCIAVICSGCVANRAYRTGEQTSHGKTRAPVQIGEPSGPAGTSVEAGNPSPGQAPSTEVKSSWPCPLAKHSEGDGDEEKTGERFDLAFIEFDDMGEFWTIGNLKNSAVRDNSQLEKALALIRRRKSENSGRVVVVTFIHGWRNNGSERDEKGKNLCGFRNTLKSLAQEDPSHRYRYIGVFVAWRGEVVRNDFIVSYFNRRDAANLIAGPSMTEALFKLMYVTRPWTAMEDVCPKMKPTGEETAKAAAGQGQGEPEEDSHFVIVGHSFGGRLLERAVAQPYMAMLVERAARQQAACKAAGDAHGVGFRSPADLIVFINPANDSLEGKAMIEGMLRLGVTTDRDGPLFLSISSQRDFATSRGMPIAQWFTLKGKATRRAYDDHARERGQLEVRQSYYHNNSEANVPEMRTHGICLADSGCTDAKVVLHFKITTPDNTTEYVLSRYLKLQKRKKDEQDRPPWNTTPFWVVSAPGALIPNHWDIFDAGARDFLKALIREYGLTPNRIRFQ